MSKRLGPLEKSILCSFTGTFSHVLLVRNHARYQGYKGTGRPPCLWGPTRPHARQWLTLTITVLTTPSVWALHVCLHFIQFLSGVSIHSLMTLTSFCPPSQKNHAVAAFFPFFNLFLPWVLSPVLAINPM